MKHALFMRPVWFMMLFFFVVAACTAVPTQQAAIENTPTLTSPPPTPTPSAPVLGTYELLSPEDMRADLDELPGCTTTTPTPIFGVPKTRWTSTVSASTMSSRSR
jgi:hypothetical protein